MSAGVVCLRFGSNVAKHDKEIAYVKSERRNVCSLRPRFQLKD